MQTFINALFSNVGAFNGIFIEPLIIYFFIFDGLPYQTTAL